MDSASLRATQAPIKAAYLADPNSAQVTLTTSSTLSSGGGISCSLSTGKAMAVAGLHPMAGGTGNQLCSGDMLLESLAACTGGTSDSSDLDELNVRGKVADALIVGIVWTSTVTLKAVATALEIPLADGTVTVEGDLDFRGTLGVDKTAQVGFKAIRVKFNLDCGDTAPEKVAKLVELTERYCVVLQTLKCGVTCETQIIGTEGAKL